MDREHLPLRGLAQGALSLNLHGGDLNVFDSITFERRFRFKRTLLCLRSAILFALSVVPCRAQNIYRAELSYFLAPEYSATARRAGQFGDVELNVSVAGDGAVKTVTVERTSSDLLAQDAKDVVGKWKFALFPLAKSKANQQTQPDGALWNGKVTVHYRFSDTPWNVCGGLTFAEVDLISLDVTVVVDPLSGTPRPSITVPRKKPLNVPEVNVPPRHPDPNAILPATRVKRVVVPRYPPLARQMVVSGDVSVSFFLDTAGKPSQFYVRAPHPLLAEAAKEAIAQWEFFPPKEARVVNVSLHYGFFPEVSDCGYRQAVAADIGAGLPGFWTITAERGPSSFP
jgi:TonB family protein